MKERREKVRFSNTSNLYHSYSNPGILVFHAQNCALLHVIPKLRLYNKL